MKIELGGIALNETKEDTPGEVTDARIVSGISIADSRNIIRHEIPGMSGSVFQDMGRAAIKVSFDGIIWGKSSKSLLETLRGKFEKGDPIPFNSDISSAEGISKVIIEDFRVSDVAGSKDRYNYSVGLREYKEDAPKSEKPKSQEEKAESWAKAVAAELANDAMKEVFGDDSKEECSSKDEGASRQTSGGEEEEGPVQASASPEEEEEPIQASASPEVEEEKLQT